MASNKRRRPSALPSERPSAPIRARRGSSPALAAAHKKACLARQPGSPHGAGRRPGGGVRMHAAVPVVGQGQRQAGTLRTVDEGPHRRRRRRTPPRWCLPRSARGQPVHPVDHVRGKVPDRRRAPPGSAGGPTEMAPATRRRVSRRGAATDRHDTRPGRVTGRPVRPGPGAWPRAQVPGVRLPVRPGPSPGVQSVGPGEPGNQVPVRPGNQVQPTRPGRLAFRSTHLTTAPSAAAAAAVTLAPRGGCPASCRLAAPPPGSPTR
jgi:hypothetical protein